MNRITPNNIQELKNNEIFVFGSNLSGIHGKGAARLAYDKFGAIWGKSNGLQGQSYAIPTKDKTVIKTLEIEYIEHYIFEFIEFAKTNKELVFLITEIGCGYAGYKPKDIALLFEECKHLDNVYLPESFWKYIELVVTDELKPISGVDSNPFCRYNKKISLFEL